MATLDAQHLSWLNTLLDQPPFEGAFERTLTPTAVVTAASVYVTRCPTPVRIPVTVVGCARKFFIH